MIELILVQIECYPSLLNIIYQCQEISFREHVLKPMDQFVLCLGLAINFKQFSNQTVLETAILELLKFNQVKAGMKQVVVERSVRKKLQDELKSLSCHEQILEAIKVAPSRFG